MLQRDPGVAGAKNGAVGDRLLEQLVFILFGRDVALQQQVRMRVDETGQDGHLRQVDDAGVARLGLNLRQGPHGTNPLAVDQDPDVGLGLGRTAVDQTAGLDENWLRCLCREGEGAREDSQQERQTAHGRELRKRAPQI